MTKYKNTKYKLKKVWDNNLNNKYRIFDEKNKKEINIAKLDFNYNFLFSKLKTNLGTDWEDLERYDSQNSYSNLYYCWFKEYFIELTKFPIKYLSFININFLYKNLTKENEEQYQIINSPLINYSYKINKEYNNNTVDCRLEIKVTLNANFTARNNNLAHQLQGKLLINIINPESYN